MRCLLQKSVHKYRSILKKPFNSEGLLINGTPILGGVYCTPLPGRWDLNLMRRTPPRGGSLFGLRTLPPEKQPQFLQEICLSSGLFIWKPPRKETLLRGGGVSVNKLVMDRNQNRRWKRVTHCNTFFKGAASRQHNLYQQKKQPNWAQEKEGGESTPRRLLAAPSNN